VIAVSFTTLKCLVGGFSGEGVQGVFSTAWVVVKGFKLFGKDEFCEPVLRTCCFMHVAG
jgi:hypothetical protein